MSTRPREAPPSPAAPELPPRRPPWRSVALILIGAVFGAVGTLTWSAGPTTRTVEAPVAAVEESGIAMLLEEPADLADTGLGLVGVLWREGEGEWTRGLSADGHPTCVAPGDEGRTVRVGLVTVPAASDRPPSLSVAWLECPAP